ncbi:hypothetical protein TNIN_177431 [Trichonephila inaurata madagascariensis]|uniref:Uncharacterized protein n=1 Tax=Trichonephila inaurata madagascariensis TaxID=2747483 RepID=A0A8X7CNZ7_9ARAC|nr:hypothetical protein TNIN_177431 [Trichonephila inaurata madagascariensis]
MEFIRFMRGSLRGRFTKIATALAEEIPSDPAELKAKLDIIVQVHEKFELLKEEYYKTVPDFEEMEIILVEMDDEIQKIEAYWGTVSATLLHIRLVSAKLLVLQSSHPLGLLEPIIAKAKTTVVAQDYLERNFTIRTLPAKGSQYLEAISVPRCVLSTSVKSIVV